MTPEDRLALHDLGHRYAACVDDRDLGRVAALFTDDAVLAVPEPPHRLHPVIEHHGPGGVRAALEALEPFRRTLHEVTGVVISAGDDPDISLGRVTGVAHHYLDRADGILDVCWRVRYDDRYRRTPDGWRVSRRAVSILALETRPVRQVLDRKETDRG